MRPPKVTFGGLLLTTANNILHFIERIIDMKKIKQEHVFLLQIGVCLCILLTSVFVLNSCLSNVGLDHIQTETESHNPSLANETNLESNTLPIYEVSESDAGTDASDPETDESVLWLDTDGIYPEEPPYLFFTYQEVLDTGAYLIGSGSIIAKYQNEVIPGDTMLKYNTSTGQFSPVCVDPYCDHLQELGLTKPLEDSCPFNCFGSPWFVWQNKLFYTRYYVKPQRNETPVVYNYHVAVASYNMATGAYDEVWWTDFSYVAANADEQTKFPANNLGRVALYGDRMYLLEYAPNKDNPVSLEDYSRSLVFIDLNTKQKTVAWCVDGTLSQDDSIMFIHQKMCYFYNKAMGRVSAYDLTTGIYRVLIEGGVRDESTTSMAVGYENKDYAEFRWGVGVCGDWLYFLTPEPYPDFYINRLNLITGERQRLCDASLWGFCMDENYLYLSLWDDRFQKEEPYLTWSKRLDVKNPDRFGTIIRLNLDGSDPTLLGTTYQSTSIVRLGHWIRQGNYFFDLTDGRTYFLGVDEPVLDPANGKLG